MSSGEVPKSVWDAGTKERREALRRNVVDTHLVTVDLAFQSGALLLDLSESGIGVQALSSAPIGNTTSLHFDLPETGGRVEAIGRIAWTDSSGRLGIRFEEMAESSRTHLAQWLASEPRPVVMPGASTSMPSWPPPHMRDEIAALRRDLVTQRLEGDEALAFVVERTRSVTRATGAAVALEENGAIVCRASSGNAPGLGAHVDPNSGLSGECVRSGEIVRCEDTETDPRADRLVCRKLELRSIIIVPIRIHGRTAGVLEAFSSRAHAFQSADVLLLRRVSDLVAGITARQPELAHPTPTGPHAVMAATVLEPLVAPAELPIEPEPDTPLMMDDILALDFVVSAPQAPPAPLEEIVFPPPAPKADVSRQAEIGMPGQVTAVPAAAAAAQAPLVSTPVSRFESAAPPVTEAEHMFAPAAAMAALDFPAPLAEPEVVSELPLPEIAIEPPAAPVATIAETVRPAPPHFVAATVPFGVEQPVKLDLSVKAAVATAPAPLTPNPFAEAGTGLEWLNQATAETEFPNLAEEEPARWSMGRWRSLRISGAAILAVVLLIGAVQAWRAFAPVKGTPMDAEFKTSQPAPASTSPDANAAAPIAPVNATSPPAPATTAPAPAPKRTAKAPGPATAEADEVTTRVVNPAALPKKTETPAEAANPPVSAAPKVEEGPPAIGFISRPVVESSAVASVLHSPVLAPSLDKPAAVSQITGGKLIDRVDPVYPHSAAGVFGEVTLKASVGTNGKVKAVKIISGNPLLAQAATIAVRRWRYTPFVLNGVPIEVENTIIVNFKAPAR